MKNITRETAINMLGEYAYNQKNGTLMESRVDGLLSFAAEHPACKVVVSKNWKNPTTPSKWNAKKLLGGTTYRYHVWAVA